MQKDGHVADGDSRWSVNQVAMDVEQIAAKLERRKDPTKTVK